MRTIDLSEDDYALLLIALGMASGLSRSRNDIELSDQIYKLAQTVSTTSKKLD